MVVETLLDTIFGPYIAAVRTVLSSSELTIAVVCVFIALLIIKRVNRRSSAANTGNESRGHGTLVSQWPGTEGGPNTVLRVVVEHMVRPVTLVVLHQIFTRVGRVLKIVTFESHKTFQALIQYPDEVTARTAMLILNGQNVYDGCCTMRIEYSKLENLEVKCNNETSCDYTNPSSLLTGDPIYDNTGALGVPTLRPNRPNPQQGRNVLLVSNLNAEEVTPDALFTLFGVYGDVQRVKILYEKKTCALIQLTDDRQAHLAMTNLDKVRVWGNPIIIAKSKHKQVKMPKEDQAEAAELTKDYSGSHLHRFKRPGSKNYKNIHAPSHTLHLSNIPPSAEEDDIKMVFTFAGFTVKNFKFFPNNRTMALIELAGVDEAVMALMKMHDYQLSETNNLRVSFSKSVMY